ncbi:GIY-YIG nuclease family protein [Streptomyces prasinus]
MPLDPNRATAVYRFFDKTGRLLYVGIAYDPAERWQHHAAKAKWWKEAVDNTIDWYDTRAEAERAEMTAIRYEKPIHNIIGNVVPYQRPPKKRGMKLPRKVPISDEIWVHYQELCAEKGVTPEEDMAAHVAARLKAHKAEQRRYAAHLRRLNKKPASDD